MVTEGRGSWSVTQKPTLGARAAFHAWFPVSASRRSSSSHARKNFWYQKLELIPLSFKSFTVIIYFVHVLASTYLSISGGIVIQNQVFDKRQFNFPISFEQTVVAISLKLNILGLPLVFAVILCRTLYIVLGDRLSSNFAT